LARQFEVFQVPDGPLVAIIQSDLLVGMRTRVVVPLLPPEVAGRPITRLTPVIELDGTMLVLMPQLIATLSLPELGTRVGSIAHAQEHVNRAIDTLLSGI
jgi:toxin CcdB